MIEGFINWKNLKPSSLLYQWTSSALTRTARHASASTISIDRSRFFGDKRHTTKDGLKRPTSKDGLSE